MGAGTCGHADIADSYPWLKPALGGGYPAPIVDEKIARRAAADAMFGFRKSSQHRVAAARVANRHGSRNWRGFMSDRHAASQPVLKKAGAANQLELDL